MTRSWFNVRASANAAPEILIYDEIGAFGVTASDFDRELKALGNPSAITLRLNSPGGDAFMGLAIHAMLQRLTAHITVFIDGLAASAASIIAMAGDEIVMPANALMMIHNPASGAVGGSAAMRQQADVLDKIANAMASIYSARSAQRLDRVLVMMNDETWMTAAEAVALGFATRVERPMQIAAHFDLKRFAHPPEFVHATVDGAARAYWARQPRPALVLPGGLHGQGPQVHSGDVTTPQPAVAARPLAGLDHEAIWDRYNRAGAK